MTLPSFDGNHCIRSNPPLNGGYNQKKKPVRQPQKLKQNKEKQNKIKQNKVKNLMFTLNLFNSVHLNTLLFGIKFPSRKRLVSIV